MGRPSDKPKDRTVKRFGPYSLKRVGPGYRVYESGKLFDTGHENYNPTWYSILQDKDLPRYSYSLFRTQEEAREGLRKYFFKNKKKLADKLGDKKFVKALDSLIEAR